jgi:hypothetical protein
MRNVIGASLVLAALAATGSVCAGNALDIRHSQLADGVITVKRPQIQLADGVVTVKRPQLV